MFFEKTFAVCNAAGFDVHECVIAGDSYYQMALRCRMCAAQMTGTIYSDARNRSYVVALKMRGMRNTQQIKK